MYEGMMRTITDVRHLSELKKNLISLDALNSISCSFMTTRGTLKVTKRAMVVMRGKEKWNLYKLIGSTVTDEVTVTTLNDFDTDSTTMSYAAKPRVC